MYRLLEEKIWFESHQALLLRIVNSYEGRELLGIDQSFPTICRVESHFISGIIDVTEDRIKLQTEFRTHGKWGKVIRHRWEEFQKLSKYFYDSGNLTHIYLEDKWQLAATTSTFYPNPGTGTAGMDGEIHRTGGELWDAIRDNTGVTAYTSSTGLQANIRASGTTDSYDLMGRAIIGFDTSAIDDTDVIASATLSIYGASVTSDLEVPTSVLTTVTPVSNTTLVGVDYEIAKYGATHLSNDIAGGSWNTAGYNDHVLNASGLANIDVAGVSNFGWRLKSDVDNLEPTWASNVDSILGGVASDTAGTASDPKLVVEHIIASTDIKKLETSYMGRTIDGLNFNQKKDIII